VTQPSNIVVSVHTTDANPDAPKYRISAQAGENIATVTLRFNPGRAPLRPGVGVRPGPGRQPSSGGFDVGNVLLGDVAPDDIPYVGAFRLVAGTRNGRRIGGIGCVTGLDRCAAPGVMPLRVEAKRVWNIGPLPEQMVADDGQFCPPEQLANPIVTQVKYADVAPHADGDVEIDVYALIEPEGWV
jgi:hypothetical protein